MRILLVEDNAGDARLVIEAVKECPVPAQVSVVQDGLQALAFLRREGQYTGAPRPDLLLLDLNLPKKDGREVLMEIKTDPVLKRIPIVILTSSYADEDVLQAYTHGANCYVLKPIDLVAYFSLMHELVSFWGTRVRLPAM